LPLQYFCVSRCPRSRHFGQSFVHRVGFSHSVLFPLVVRGARIFLLSFDLCSSFGFSIWASKAFIFRPAVFVLLIVSCGTARDWSQFSITGFTQEFSGGLDSLSRSLFLTGQEEKEISFLVLVHSPCPTNSSASMVCPGRSARLCFACCAQLRTATVGSAFSVLAA
jgi:hypothetical protein